MEQILKNGVDGKRTRVILIGKSTAGKTTLCQCISKEELKYHKTQTVQIVNKNMIDTPGEYLERTGYRGALAVASVDADVILLVQDATEAGTMFPPMFNSMFTKPCVGVVTKADIASEEQVERAKKYLKNAGAGSLYVTSAVTGEGVDELVKQFHLDAR